MAENLALEFVKILLKKLQNLFLLLTFSNPLLIFQ